MGQICEALLHEANTSTPERLSFAFERVWRRPGSDFDRSPASVDVRIDLKVCVGDRELPLDDSAPETRSSLRQWLVDVHWLVKGILQGRESCIPRNHPCRFVYTFLRVNDRVLLRVAEGQREVDGWSRVWLDYEQLMEACLDFLEQARAALIRLASSESATGELAAGEFWKSLTTKGLDSIESSRERLFRIAAAEKDRGGR